MIYGFWCDCGHEARAEFSPDDPEKKVHCPACGTWMYRDYRGIGITGDLPSKRPQGGILKSGAYTDDEIPGGALLKEVDYVEKNHGPDAREQNTATRIVADLAHEHRRSQREAEFNRRFDKADFTKPKGMDLTDGRV